MLLSFLVVVFASNTIAHVGINAYQNVPMRSTWDKLDAIIGTKPQKILGPHILRMKYQNNFRDINALVLDYFYSGQKNPVACIDRFKPDILVIDDEIRRRFDFEFGDVYNKIGETQGNFHHSTLEIYSNGWR